MYCAGNLYQRYSLVLLSPTHVHCFILASLYTYSKSSSLLIGHILANQRTVDLNASKLFSLSRNLRSPKRRISQALFSLKVSSFRSVLNLCLRYLDRLSVTKTTSFLSHRTAWHDCFLTRMCSSHGQLYSSRQQRLSVRFYPGAVLSPNGPNIHAERHTWFAWCSYSLHLHQYLVPSTLFSITNVVAKYNKLGSSFSYSAPQTFLVTSYAYSVRHFFISNFISAFYSLACSNNTDFNSSWVSFTLYPLSPTFKYSLPYKR